MKEIYLRTTIYSEHKIEIKIHLSDINKNRELIIMTGQFDNCIVENKCFKSDKIKEYAII